jgi:uncharacterized protein YbjT (DUF2867 family)
LKDPGVEAQTSTFNFQTNPFHRMSYLIFGGSGHTSKIITEKLLAAGKDVTVVGRNAENLKSLTAKGAKAAIGSIEDKAFLVEAFKGKDTAYVMVPPNFATPDFPAYQKLSSDNVVEAIKANGTKNIVLLSSIGSHLRHGAGVIDGLGYTEELLAQIPDLNVKILRPGFFYTNFFSQLSILKAAGILGSNYGPDVMIPMVHPNDIGSVAAEELLSLSFKGQTVRYIASEELTSQEATTILGKAIGKPDLKWVQFPDDQSLAGMKQAGLMESLAEGYVQMGIAFNSGKGQEDYLKHKPTLSPTKMSEFTKEFAAAYNAG